MLVNRSMASRPDLVGFEIGATLAKFEVDHGDRVAKVPSPARSYASASVSDHVTEERRLPVTDGQFPTAVGGEAELVPRAFHACT